MVGVVKADELITRADLEAALDRQLERFRELLGSRTEIEPVVGTEEAAGMLGICGRTLLKMIRNGEIPAMRLGSGWRVRREDIAEYIDRRIEEQKAG